MVSKEERLIVVKVSGVMELRCTIDLDTVWTLLNVQEMRSAGCRLLAEGELYWSEKKKKDTEVTIKKARDGPTFLQGGKVTHRSNRYMKRETGDGEPSPSADVRSSQKPRSSGHHSHSSGTVKVVKKSAILPDLTGYPGMEMLSLAVSISATVL